jgi:hypothetical protein
MRENKMKADTMTLTIPLDARKIAVVLALVAMYLAAQSIFGRSVEDLYEGDTTILVANLVRVFNINRESSIPTWYSSALLLGCSAVLGIIAAAKRVAHEPYTIHWTALALIFLYMSIDETASIHEKFTEPLQVVLNPTSHLYFAWVIVAVPLVVIFALAYLKFLFHLPPRVRNLFALAGVIYVGGALVVESISANQWYWDGGTSLLYSAMGTLEELFEMFGTILLLYILLYHIQQLQVAVDLRPTARHTTPSQPTAAHAVTAARTLSE